MKAHHANKMLVNSGEKRLQDRTDNKNNLFILFKFKYYVTIHHKHLDSAIKNEGGKISELELGCYHGDKSAPPPTTINCKNNISFNRMHKNRLRGTKFFNLQVPYFSSSLFVPLELGKGHSRPSLEGF